MPHPRREMCYGAVVAKGSAKTFARSKRIRKRDGAWLDAQALAEHSVPRPITVTFVDPQLLRQHIREMARH